MEEENKSAQENTKQLPEDESMAEDAGMAEAELINPITNDTQNPETDMEVHHHTHAPHGKKTWKHYFWEFLMLFLAVFCGFLAEYQLEHVIENQREKVFIKSMMEDLQNDHDKLSNYLFQLKEGLGQMDSMVTLLNDEKNITQHGNELYYYGRISPRIKIFSNNNRTFDQLKNSGGFRLIRNANASSQIMEYYGSLQHIRYLEDLYFLEFEEYKKLAAKIFDPVVMRSMELPNGAIKKDAGNPALRSNDTDKLKEMAVFAVYMNGSRRSIIPEAEALQQNAAKLGAFLKQAYKLD